MPLPSIGAVAPAFTLRDHDGETVSLADFTGRHALVWFFARAFGTN